MKKVSIAMLFIAALAVTSCHYGQEEAKKTLDRNQLYKGDKADYSVNRAGEGGKMHSEGGSTAGAPTESTPAKDSTAAAAPAGHGH